jgi:thioredoxin 1
MPAKTSILLLLVAIVLAGCQNVASDAPPAHVVAAGMPADQWFQEEVVASQVPVVVEFGATWCPPCKKLKPLLEDLNAKSEGKFKVVTIDVDERPHLASHFEVSPIPLLLLIDGGVVKRYQVGLVSRTELKKFAMVPTE